MSEKQKLILSISVLFGSLIIGSIIYFNVDSRLPLIAFVLIAPNLAIAITNFIIEKEIDLVSTLLSVVGLLYFLLALPSDGLILHLTKENSTYIVLALAGFFLLFNLFYLFTKSED